MVAESGWRAKMRDRASFCANPIIADSPTLHGQADWFFLWLFQAMQGHAQNNNISHAKIELFGEVRLCVIFAQNRLPCVNNNKQHDTY
jgi:hypothetical protein